MSSGAEQAVRGRVAVGMSGGVDSTMTAWLLKQAGAEVVGVTMQIWDGSVNLPPSTHPGCFGPGEIQDLEKTRLLAQRLDIPYVVIPLAVEYRERVLDYFRREYLAGRTPNPCVVCNHELKFGLLPEKARHAGVEFDFFATGHYARVAQDPVTGRYGLWRGTDRFKDQSYFLFHLDQAQLRILRLPLGTRTKSEIVRLARENGFADVAAQPQSQDFIESESYAVLFQPSDAMSGPIVDSGGRRLGTHRGLMHYTVGQREGLGVAAQNRLYVKELHPDTNTVVVAPRDEVFSAACEAHTPHWIAGEPPPDETECEVQLRYRSRGVPAVLHRLAGDRVLARFAAPQFAVTPGQAAVFYRGDEVLGGGWISNPSAAMSTGSTS